MRRGLAGSIRTRQAAGVMPVLSEIKVRSPKDGDLLRGRDPGELATAMAGAGIAGLSIVTAPEDFDGDLSSFAASDAASTCRSCERTSPVR